MNEKDFKALFGNIDPTTLTQAELARIVASGNNRPIDDFCGLSSVQMNALLYEPLGGASPIRVRKDIAQEVFEGMPFFRLVEELLTIIDREGEITLTGTGALPPRFVRELYEMRIMPQYDIEHGISKLSKEADWPVLQGALTVAEAAGLLRTVKKKMLLTQEGTERLEEGSRRDLFIDVLRVFTGTLNWAYFDLYESEEIGRFGWGYTIYLFLLFGEKPRPVGFYADLYRRAFPMLYSEEPEPGRYPIPPFKRFVHCYGLRTFSRFLGWFGWVEGDPERLMWEDEKVVAGSEVFRGVFETDVQ